MHDDDSRFCIKSCQKFANLLPCKAPKKKTQKKKDDFPKNVESTVVLQSSRNENLELFFLHQKNLVAN